MPPTAPAMAEKMEEFERAIGQGLVHAQHVTSGEPDPAIEPTGPASANLLATASAHVPADGATVDPVVTSAPALNPNTTVSFTLTQFIVMIATVATGVLGPVLWAQGQVNTLRAEEVAAVSSLRTDLVSKTDFNELKGQIATLTTTVSDLKVAVATMTERLAGTTKALEDLKAAQKH